MYDKVIEVEAETIETCPMNYKVNRKVWQILWDAIMTPVGFGNGGRHYNNDIFEHYPYSWDDHEGMVNGYHFHHKPSGLKIQWYKYPLRGANCNMDITDNQFVDILYDCFNSLQPVQGNVRIIYDTDKWWEIKQEQEDNE